MFVRLLLIVLIYPMSLHPLAPPSPSHSKNVVIEQEKWYLWLLYQSCYELI